MYASHPKTYLVDSPEGGHVHSLTPHSSSATDTGRVLTWAGVNDGVHNNLEKLCVATYSCKMILDCKPGEGSLQSGDG